MQMHKLVDSEFASNASNTLQNLLHDNELTDVTIACDDDKQVKAHKFMLCASSSFFHEIFLQNTQPSSWIYLQGVGSGELQSIIKFIYLGETEVDEILLQNVLKMANYLKIKGLTETMCEIKIENESKEETCKDDILDFTEAERKLFNEQPKIEPDNLKIMMNSETDSKQSMTKVRNLSCTKCPYKGTTNKTLKAHIMTKHEGVKFPCSDCPFISNTSKTRYMHTLKPNIKG